MANEIYPYFLTACLMAGPAFLRSSGTITGTISRLALKARNQGSAKAGICEASFMSTISSAVRFPLDARKYAASGFRSSRMDRLFLTGCRP